MNMETYLDASTKRPPNMGYFNYNFVYTAVNKQAKNEKSATKNLKHSV